MSARSDLTEKAIAIVNDTLMLTEDYETRSFDFNKAYAGYYPAMTLTAVSVCHGQYAVCGTDAEGVPHLYLSPDGTVWTPRTMLPAESPGWKGRITAILQLPVGE